MKRGRPSGVNEEHFTDNVFGFEHGKRESEMTPDLARMGKTARSFFRRLFVVFPVIVMMMTDGREYTDVTTATKISTRLAGRQSRVSWNVDRYKMHGETVVLNQL